MILYPHLESDQHRNLTTSRGSFLAHAYQVCSTSINVYVSYHADRRTQTHTVITIPTLPQYRGTQVAIK